MCNLICLNFFFLRRPQRFDICKESVTLVEDQRSTSQTGELVANRTYHYVDLQEEIDVHLPASQQRYTDSQRDTDIAQIKECS